MAKNPGAACSHPTGAETGPDKASEWSIFQNEEFFLSVTAHNLSVTEFFLSVTEHNLSVTEHSLSVTEFLLSVT